MPQRPPDYLTETHKIRKALWKRNLEYYVGLSIAILIFSYALFDLNVSSLFLTKEQHELIKKYEQLAKQYLAIKNYKASSYYITKKNEIVKQTPTFITIYHVYLKWKQKDLLYRKILFTVLYFSWYFFIAIFAHLLIKYYLNKMRPLIYQIPKVEEVLPLINQKIITLNEMFKHNQIANIVFSDPNKVEKIINTAIVFHDVFNNIKREFQKFVDIHISIFTKYVATFYPDLNKEETPCFFSFLLWHYVINFYGNLPTGVLSIYIKNDDFKIILSAYQRKVLPVIYTKRKKSPHSTEFIIEYQKDKFYSYFFLRALYEIDRMTNLYVNIEDKFSMLPFQTPISFQ